MIKTVLLLLFFALSVALVTYFISKKRIESRLFGYHHALLENHILEVNDVYRQMRAWKHDYHNHLQLMQAYLEMDKHSDMKAHLMALTEDIGTMDPLVRSGNVMVDAILNCKLSPLKEKGILVSAKATVPPNRSLPEVDLCAVVGNLLDNAIEALLRMPETETRFIRVYMRPMEEQLYLSITNAMSGRPKKGFKSLKRIDQMGFGLLRVDQLVKKHGGYVNRQHEDGVFATEIMLPFVHQT